MPKAPKKWTAEEDRILHQEVIAAGEDGRPRSWTAIAACLPNRTNKDCRKRWCNHLVGGLRKGPWSDDEDERLRNSIQKHGQQWPLVSEDVRTRSGDQCAKRWNQALDPAIDRSNWTEDEQRTLLKAVREHGRSWKQIQELYFPERATNNVKNRYTTLAKGDRLGVDQTPSEISESSYSGTESSPSDYLQSFDMSSECFSTDAATCLENSDQSSTHIQSLTTIPDPLNMDEVDFDYLNIDPFFMDYMLKSIPQESDVPKLQQCPISDLEKESNTGYVFDSPMADSGYMIGLDPSETVVQNHNLSNPHAMDSAALQKFVITIDEPNPEMVGDIMGLLVTRKARFKSEMQQGG